MDRIDDQHIERIRGLPIWSGPILLERLSGGITNRNFLVHDGEARFVARIGEELPLLGVDRRNERLCHVAAVSAGVAPPILFAENGVLVTRYIPSRTLDAVAARESGFPTRLAGVLRAFHQGWDSLVGDLLFFSPIQASRTYVETSRHLGAELPRDIDVMLEAMRKASRSLAPYTPTLCHNDMLPANVLDDGDRVWIVDWEYAGVGHPLFDLAGFSVNCLYSDEQDREFLAAYRGDLDPTELRDLRVLKVASLLREAMWSVVQTVASDLDFDFRGYALKHFDKFREALARLESA